MTWYPDLSTASIVGHGADVRTIGWLSPEQPFRTGGVPDTFTAALSRHLTSPCEPIHFRGAHRCEIDTCGRAAATVHGTLGCANLWIPTAARVYIAPEMVLHYVRDHRYRPPDEFIEAVLACPDQSSPAYEALMAPFRSPHEDQRGLNLQDGRRQDDPVSGRLRRLWTV